MLIIWTSSGSMNIVCPEPETSCTMPGTLSLWLDLTAKTCLSALKAGTFDESTWFMLGSDVYFLRAELISAFMLAIFCLISRIIGMSLRFPSLSKTLEIAFTVCWSSE
mgnify:CR=1 FL=1